MNGTISLPYNLCLQRKLMTAFANFTNPYQGPASIPDKYRHHPRLQGLFQPDGRYTRPAEDPVTLWVIDRLHTHYGVPLAALGDGLRPVHVGRFCKSPRRFTKSSYTFWPKRRLSPISFRRRFLIRCIPKPKSVSSLLDNLSSGGYWWWFILTGEIEFVS